MKTISYKKFLGNNNKLPPTSLNTKGMAAGGRTL